MRFLICGLGSIGQRHVRILRKLLGKDAVIYAHRKRKLSIVINDDMTAVEGSDPVAHYGLIDEPSLDRALDQDLDAVFVTNPISMHVETAIEAAQKGHNLFIEKPLGAGRKGIDELEGLVRQGRLVTLIGYQLRFHPALKKIKQLLDAKAIGDVIEADIHFGEWLPGMHPYEDYRTSHAAKRDQGGGVVLCLSHEIDYACWLFGAPRKVFAAGGHLSSLDLDVEDSASLLLHCEQASDGAPFAVHVHLNFIQRPAERHLAIVGTQGSLFWDYYSNVITIRRGDRIDEETFPGWTRNDMFEAELDHFLKCIRDRSETTIPVSEGARTLRVCLAALESLASGEAVSP